MTNTTLNQLNAVLSTAGTINKKEIITKPLATSEEKEAFNFCPCLKRIPLFICN